VKGQRRFALCQPVTAVTDGEDAVTQANVDAGAFGRELDGVVEEVHYCSLERRVVSVDSPGLRRDFKVVVPAPTRCASHRALNRFVETDRVVIDGPFVLAGQVNQVVHKVREFDGLLLDVSQQHLLASIGERASGPP
jgi:hypothetical protein